MKIDDIDVSKITWEFWQSSHMYDYGNGFVCLFKTEIKPVDKHGHPCIPLPRTNHDYWQWGTFSIYSTFKMSGNKIGIDKSRSLKMIDISLPIAELEHDFRQIGIYEVLNQLQK